MGRINISVPDWLVAALADVDMNVSKVCQRALAEAVGVAPPQGSSRRGWARDEKSTEWAVRSVDRAGEVHVSPAPGEEMAREWARRFPINHPMEYASAEPVLRTVVRRESEWSRVEDWHV